MVTKMTPLPALRRAARLVVVAGVVWALGGCGGDASSAHDSSSTSTTSAGTSARAGDPSSPTASGSSSSSATPRERTIAVTLERGRVTPAPRTVDLRVGETITLTVTSDHADELHVHGFDIEKQLPAGQAVSVELTGQSPGVYEVETHEPALRLLKIAVR